MTVNPRGSFSALAILIATTLLPVSESTAEGAAYQTIEQLKQSESVIPPQPNVHPVALVYNREAIIPPQCYTRTEGKHNPCYVCHQDAIPERENVMHDAELQVAYSFSELGTTNHWKNLFEDRGERVASISDQEIDDWVAENNYSELPRRLVEAGFEGWIPDLHNLQLGADAFDSDGFAKDGSHWVAFNYKPLPSTFWPTNGSTDDVMIRLPEQFRSDAKGRYSKEVYKANLAVLEAKMKGLSAITSLPIDETAVERDLNGDGQLGTAHRIAEVNNYLGAAENEFADTFLYPQGTEFLHTVRYLDIAANGDIEPSTRLKEVRYMRKWKAYRKPVYARYYQLEGFEKELGNLPGYHYLGDHGLDNGMGWAIHGFIEDSQGRLRANTYEENLFCMGCHNSMGSTIDKTFSFARKVDGAKGWGYINLRGMPDAPNHGEQQGEYLTYLQRVGGGSEFRNNNEMFARWFKADGSVDEEKVQRVADIYQLITPSPERARQLNKAYRLIVQDQDFIFGRDATVSPPDNVYQQVDQETVPTLPADRVFEWDIRLDWDASQRSEAESAQLTP